MSETIPFSTIFLGIEVAVARLVPGHLECPTYIGQGSKPLLVLDVLYPPGTTKGCWAHIMQYFFISG
jgi:hypothetical protein